MDASAAATRVRWGIPDAALAWFLGLLAATVAGGVAAGIIDVPSDELADHLGYLLVVIAAQGAATIAFLALVARRKGRGSLARDFGLVVRLRDVGWVGVGSLLELAAVIALQPIVEVYGREEDQGVVDQLKDARGVGLALFVVAVLVLAPVAEELLFRGVLLRALLRRTSPGWAMFVSAAVFALVHPLGDPEIGSVIAVPAVLTLGLVSGYQAIRTGNLSRSICLHAGFNLLTVLVVLTD
ncbi:MAG TPA: type II CAAX endopeptidase family protein [Actinomycetota bacterium]|nr:type II CAAX endopeptidase family protein [Actinomycetota bacterium]